MRLIENGCCAAIGFKAGGIHAGIRKNHAKKDLAIIISCKKAIAASVYTTNLVKGAPLLVTQNHLKDGYAQAIIVNSGNANTCSKGGVAIANRMCELVSEYTGIDKSDVIIASTGIIGQPLDVSIVENAMPKLLESISLNCVSASEAIMTTDKERKEAAVEFMINDKVCHIGGIAKGSGMVHPNMATMLSFITTDCNISLELLEKALRDDVKNSFNMISVDGDTSTNDMVSIMANGMALNDEITLDDGYNEFVEALGLVTSTLCRKIAKEGAGSTKLIECKVVNAYDELGAKTIAKTVISSSLIKAAMFGSDANCGRILCAIGYAGVELDVDRINVSYQSRNGEILVCEKGICLSFDEALAKKILLSDEVTILIDLNAGDAFSTAWGCDLTYEYVKTNGDYRR